MRRPVYVLGALALSVALAKAPSDLGAQGAPTARVRVRQVAGATLYLDVGTRHGLATGDTLRVDRDGSDAPAGRLTVTASTATRSVLAFVGKPFPLTRGAYLVLHLLRQPAEAAPEAASPRPGPMPMVSRPPSYRAGPPQVQGARAHGRIGLELSATRSVTSLGDVASADVSRTFATPAVRLDATVPEAVGGFALRTSTRLAYRYSDIDLIQPVASVRVYAAALEKTFTSVPLQLSLGRFRSPVETYSGYWDGAFIRVGRAVGVGTILGFEPQRWDERPSLSRPKATVFADGMARGPGWRWSGNVSGHFIAPTDGAPDHAFFGATERLTLGPVYFGHDVQVDRNPTGGGWRLSRLHLRAALALSRAVEVHGAFSRYETWLEWLPDEPFAPRVERVEVGLSLRGSSKYLSLDGSQGRDFAGRTTRGATASFSLGGGDGGGSPALTGIFTRWKGDYGTTLLAAPGLAFDFRPAWWRVGYRYTRSDYLQSRLRTHAVESSLDLPLAEQVRLSARARLQWGGVLAAQSLMLTLTRIF